MLRPKRAPQKQPPRRRARSKSNTSAARRKKAPPSATGACTGNARGYPMRGRAWGTRGVENITSSNENLNAALQGGMPRDGLHNPRESVVVGGRNGPQGVFSRPIARLLARKATQWTDRGRVITDRTELCRPSQVQIGAVLSSGVGAKFKRNPPRPPSTPARFNCCAGPADSPLPNAVYPKRSTLVTCHRSSGSGYGLQYKCCCSR